MAESFLFSIAESLIAKLASRAFEEASRLLGVYDDLREFKETLLYVKAVLLDAEQKQEHNHELRVWMRRIKRVLSDAENVLDEVDCETLRKQVVKAYGTTKTKVGRFFSSSNPLVSRYRMAQNIKDVRKRLDRVAADRDKFGLQIIDADRRVVHRRELTYSHVVESTVIGRDEDKENIVQLLVQQNPHDEDESLSVLPIVGIGGLGKTTLAKFVYSDKRITESYPLKMWVCVSDDFDIKQLIVKIINSADESASTHQQNLNMLDTEQLQIHLRNKLAGQKFLLVLDDVWNEDRVKWVELRDLIQVGAAGSRTGSRILVTTRNHKIASMMGTISPYNLEGLSLEDSLSLFVKWAFKEGEEGKYPNLVAIGREIVKKTRGVPLAARTVGSLLFSKFETDEWKSIRDNGIWNLPQTKDDILPALKLSYDQMPSYLRQCFALLSLYPKDYEFDSFDVASLWGAAGFLSSPSQNRSSVDVANQYLLELMSRSFLQEFIDLGALYAFKIHDLVHDLALYIAKDECLLQNSLSQNIPENVLHISFIDFDLLGKSFTPNSSGMRTILFPTEEAGAINEAILNTWVSRYKYLRFLDLSGSTCKTLPRSIGKLKHLRYFSLSENKKLKILPDSICMLQNLQVLRLDGCMELEILPKGLRNLISLQRLEITTKQSVLRESDIASLSSLEYLCIESCDKMESLFVGVKLPTLRTLEVVSCESLKFFPFDSNHFPQLETLKIDGCGNLELSQGHDQDIQNSSLRLKLLGLLHMPQLVTLPHWLQASADTLVTLSIHDCDRFEVLPEWLSSLSSLKCFGIRRCPKLTSLPKDIHHLTALELLDIEGCPELCTRCQPQFGEYWTKISNIKKILIDGEEPEDPRKQLMEGKRELMEEKSFDNPDKH